MMKQYIVIGNPIEHSLSPKLHNHWFKKNNIEAVYDKKKINEKNLGSIISEAKEGKIHGINVTVPFKKSVIPYLDKLSTEAKQTQSVNTIVLIDDILIGHNTDIFGFTKAIKSLNFNIEGKKVFILGAGGVVPSIIFALKKMSVSKIIVSNRTKNKAEDLKSLFHNLEVLDWGDMVDFDVIINATSLGLNENDKFEINFSKLGKDKFFYDVIYNPFNTEFAEAGNKPGNIFENGLHMFLFQAQKAFSIWHNIEPKIDQEVIKFLKGKN